MESDEKETLKQKLQDLWGTLKHAAHIGEEPKRVMEELACQVMETRLQAEEAEVDCREIDAEMMTSAYLFLPLRANTHLLSGCRNRLVKKFGDRFNGQRWFFDEAFWCAVEREESAYARRNVPRVTHAGT